MYKTRFKKLNLKSKVNTQQICKSFKLKLQLNFRSYLNEVQSKISETSLCCMKLNSTLEKVLLFQKIEYKTFKVFGQSN